MNGCSSLSSDIITTLPQQITENILTCMPIRDALRTSILSSKWRYSWTTIPTLEFDYYWFEAESDNPEVRREKFLDSIFHVLFLHRGPILEIYLSINEIDEIEVISKFDQIIHHLSRRNDLKKLHIEIANNFYKLPTSFFSLQGLEELELRNCDIRAPLTFNGFRRLRKLFFSSAEVRPKMVQTFLSSCPLLEEVSLGVKFFDDGFEKYDEYADDLAERNTSTFVEFLPCVPLIQYLDVPKYYMKYMAAGGMPHRLPTSLVHLKRLYLGLCLKEQDEISSVLCLIRSSPNLEDISFKMYYEKKLPLQKTSVDFFDPKDYSDLKLDHLEKLEIQGFRNFRLETEFVKLIMAKSPMLKEARIELYAKVFADKELKIVKDFLLLPFSRAPTAKLIIERPSWGKLGRSELGTFMDYFVFKLCRFVLIMKCYFLLCNKSKTLF